MANRPKKRNQANPAIAALLAAVKFTEPAAKEIGSPQQTHIKLQNNLAIAFDGVIALGSKIDTDISACPHTLRLIDALSKCSEAVQITQLSNGRLSIKSGGFQVYIPCIEPDILGFTAPDPPCAVIDDRVKTALTVVGRLTNENAQRLHLASVLLRSGSAVGTDGVILFEYWHSWDLPTIAVPKSLVTALGKIDKKLCKFGFSRTSATFYFEDESWIRTQLFIQEPWPDLAHILNVKTNQWPIPAGFWEALSKVSDFAESGRVYFENQRLRTHPSGVDDGATCELAGALPANLVFDADYLQMVQAYVTTADFLTQATHGPMAIFHGDNFRAMLMHIRNEHVAAPATGTYIPPDEHKIDPDDEIPF